GDGEVVVGGHDDVAARPALDEVGGTPHQHVGVHLYVVGAHHGDGTAAGGCNPVEGRAQHDVPAVRAQVDRAGVAGRRPDVDQPADGERTPGGHVHGPAAGGPSRRPESLR